MTKSTIMLYLLPVLMLAAGCRDKSGDTDSTQSASQQPQPQQQAPASPNDVLVEVGGSKLTRAQVDMEVQERINAGGERISPEQLRRNAVSRFISKTLLINEANAQNITVTEKEEDEAYEQINARLAPGMTMDRLTGRSPAVEERMREEVVSAIKINKLLAQRVPSQIEISDAQISAFYEQNKGKLTVPEKVHARHILVSTDRTNDEQVKAEKRKKAEEIKKELEAGGDFAALANKYSDCPSKQNGGDLGEFVRGQMVQPFSDAAFSQKIGAIGPIVETEFGYHVIQVLKHDEPQLLPREQVIDILKRQQQQKAITELIAGLEAKSEIKYHDTSLRP